VADVGKAVYQQVKLGAAYLSATEAKSTGGVEGGHVVFSGNADEDEATLGFVSEVWSGKYGTPADYGTIAGGARRAAKKRVGETIEAVTERPIETITTASMPIMWLVGLATTSGKATYTALEASDTADEAQRNEMYGEALFGAADTVSQIGGARTDQPGAVAKPGSFLQSRLGRTLTAPLWGFLGAGGSGAGTLRARQLGVAGEAGAGILKNTTRIPSLGRSAAYRIPDVLDRVAGLLGEVKNVGKLSYSSQLRDFVNYSQQEGLRFELTTREGTKLSGPLQRAVDAGDILLLRNLP
jgi:hypothetical protein